MAQHQHKDPYKERGRREKQSQGSRHEDGHRFTCATDGSLGVQECLQSPGLGLEACTGGGSVGVISPYRVMT